MISSYTTNAKRKTRRAAAIFCILCTHQRRSGNSVRTVLLWLREDVRQCFNARHVHLLNAQMLFLSRKCHRIGRNRHQWVFEHGAAFIYLTAFEAG